VRLLEARSSNESKMRHLTGLEATCAPVPKQSITHYSNFLYYIIETKNTIAFERTRRCFNSFIEDHMTTPPFHSISDSNVNAFYTELSLPFIPLYFHSIHPKPRNRNLPLPLKSPSNHKIIHRRMYVSNLGPSKWFKVTLKLP